MVAAVVTFIALAFVELLFALLMLASAVDVGTSVSALQGMLAWWVGPRLVTRPVVTTMVP